MLGKLEFDGRPLSTLLIDAIRYGERPEVRARLQQTIEGAVNPEKLRELLAERGLPHELINLPRVQEIREAMERAEARRLQPHFIESFSLAEARERLREREPRRFEIRHVPAELRCQAPPTSRGAPLLARYERVTFKKISQPAAQAARRSPLSRPP